MARANWFFVLMAVLTPSLLAVDDSTKTSQEASSSEEALKRYLVSRTKDAVTYEGLATFILGPPWNRPFVPAPESPDNVNTTFYLFTRKSPEHSVIKILPTVDMTGTDFQPDRKTFILTHGFGSDTTAKWMKEMKDAILSKVDGNVILTDWGKGAREGNYFQVVANTRIVGAEMARLLKHLDELGLSLSNVHMIGHSLGAQASSYVAKARPGIGRITAMDPAQPSFEHFDKDVRIDPSDAQFVDVIHTNAKVTVPHLGFGMIRPVGHVDFYLNGGADQPGCAKAKLEKIDSIQDLLKIPISVLGDLISCSHGRSHEYMIEAIASDCKMWGHPVSLMKDFVTFVSGGVYHIPRTHGKKCNLGACIPLGLDTPEYPARGTFSVETGSSSPYCIKERSNEGQDLKTLRSLGIIPDSKL